MGVFAGYASRQGYALVDKRLFLPEVWFTEAYAARQARCQVPAEVTFRTKPQLAAAMLHHIVPEGLLPFKYVVADCLYGNSPDFLDAVDAWVGVTTLGAIPSETRCWLQRPGQRTGHTSIKARNAPSGWSSPPTARHAPWRRWRRACRHRAGISARYQKAPKDRLPMRLPANA